MTFRLAQAGYFLSRPITIGRYDIIAEDASGTLRRIQVKTGRLAGGAVKVKTSSVKYKRRNTDDKNALETYVGQVDAFGVYCPQNDQVYIVPLEVVGTRTELYLRVVPTKSGRRIGCTEAEPYRLLSG